MHHEHRIIYRQLGSPGLPESTDMHPENTLDAQVVLSVKQHARAAFGEVLAEAELQNALVTVEAITAQMEHLSLPEQSVFIAEILGILPAQLQYEDLRYKLIQVLNLHAQQERIDAVEDVETQRLQILEMINVSLLSIRQNPDNLQKTVTHNGVSMTIKTLIEMLNNAKKALENGASIKEVEAMLY